MVESSWIGLDEELREGTVLMVYTGEHIEMEWGYWL